MPVISYSGRFPTLKEVEDYLISEALERAEGNQTVAARMLGVSQSTLSRRLSR
jgi:DNA-binding protein Fis